MMSWFTPKCPVDDETREWIDKAFQWLIDELGVETLREVEVILPTEKCFPDPYNGSPKSIRKMLERVCGYMDVDPSTIEIQFFENEDANRYHPLAAEESGQRHALGTYQMRPGDGKYIISLDTSQAANPETMVATIAHELGHVILLGGRLSEDYEDHEPLTDLVTVFYGLGIFNGNSSFVFEQFTNSQFQGWRAGSSGYLSEQMFGYALALFAHNRGESKPSWMKYLSTNVNAYMKKSLRFLHYIKA